MSFFSQVLAGYIGEKNNMAREAARQAREDELSDRNLQDQKELAKFQSGLALDATKAQNAMTFFSNAPKEVQAALATNTTWLQANGLPKELADLSISLKDADETTPLGNITLPFIVDTGKDEDVFAGVDSLELYLAQNPDFIEKVNADEATKRAVTAYVGTLYNNYNAFWHDKFSKTDAVL